MRKVTKRRNPPGSPPKWSLTRHYIETRELIQIGPDDDIWRTVAAGDHSMPFKGNVLTNCIAKITPPAGTSESDVLAVENALFSRGARAVRRMPSPPEDLVVAPQHDQAPEQEGHRTLLQVAVDRARRGTSVDKDALVELVELAMSQTE